MDTAAEQLKYIKENFPERFFYCMTPDQYDRYENMMLGIPEVELFSATELSDILKRYNEEMAAREELALTAERNNLGIIYEKEGKIEDAISIYELNIIGGYPATHSYDRLMILYRRLGRKRDEIRVIDLAISKFPKYCNKYLKRKQALLKRTGIN